MKAESVVFAIAGSLFGLIVGWILGSQQTARTTRLAAPVAEQVAAPATAGTSAAAALDQDRIQSLTTTAESNPKDPAPRVQLGNAYFDAERYTDAIAWYDNSSANKSNPDPTKDVWWGDQTWEEMMFTGLTFSVVTPASPQ